MNIYLASSWRNEFYEETLKKLRKHFCVYDFKKSGFEWHEVLEKSDELINTPSRKWVVTGAELLEALIHPLAVKHFENDRGALEASDLVVLVLPCGRSAHLEAGFAMGRGKPVVIYSPPDVALEPELMYLLGGTPENIFDNFGWMMTMLKGYAKRLETERRVFR